ncbi:MAG: tetratricopeptide repeat protein [Opitutales bacterium]|nr:tetratricopeptide repeat protein [Opitutales bacterium]
MRFSLRALIVAGLLAFGSQAGAQSDILPSLETESAALVKMRLANDTLQMGLTDLAELFSKDALSSSGNDLDRSRMSILLATAQMSQGKLDEAQKTLDLAQGSPQKSLRLAILNLEKTGDWRAAQDNLASFAVDELTQNDLPWFYLARGIVAAYAGEFLAMRNDFDQAVRLAVSQEQAMHFRYYRLRCELIFCKDFVNDERLASLREEAMRSRGTSEGINFTRLYIEALAVAGRLEEAREAFSLLGEVPSGERINFDLLEALLQDSPGTAEAQQAFMNVIRGRPDREIQEIAFTGLWLGVTANAEAGRTELARSLAANVENFLSDNVQTLPTGTPLPPDSRVEDLELLTRMRIAVETGEDLRAEHLAQELLAKYPSSPLGKDALQFLVSTAYRQGDFVKLSHCFERLMALSANEPERLQIYQVALADCYANVGDYAHAATLYTEAGQSIRGNEKQAALLMFQRVFSYVRNKDFSQAIMLLDLPSQENESEDMRSWKMRAECVLISALRDSGRLEQALTRSKTFLENRDLWVDFRVRALWLQMLTVVELKLPDMIQKTTNDLIEILTDLPEGASETIIRLREDFLAWTYLQKVRGFLIAGEESEALAQLKFLRGRFENSVPAAISYIDEARFYADRSQHTEALRAYENLIVIAAGHEDLQPYATIAYFESAQQNVALGREREAANNYEQLLKNYPDSPFVFYARSRQADLLRAQNEFDAALAVYDALINDFADHNDIHRIEIARADCLLALASESRVAGTSLKEQLAKIDRAIIAYERLYSLPDGDCALMAESGNKWAYALLQKASLLAGTEKSDAERLVQEAKKLYWTVVDAVVHKSGDSEDGKISEKLGTTGGYWLARSLFNLAAEYEKGQDFKSARDIYAFIVDLADDDKIPGKEYARTRLAAIKDK